MASIIRSKEQIEEMLNRTYKADETGVSIYPGMKYEDGVRAALDWLFSEDDEDPLPPEEDDEVNPDEDGEDYGDAE